MKITTSLVALTISCAVGAWSADVVVERAPSHFKAPTSLGRVKALYH